VGAQLGTAADHFITFISMTFRLHHYLLDTGKGLPKNCAYPGGSRLIR